MRRLLVAYGMAMVSAVLLALLLPLGVLARSQAYDSAVEAARQEAQGLAVIASTADRETLRESVQALNDGARQTTVYLPDGTSVGEPAPRTASVRLASSGRAFTARTDGGVEVLLPVSGSRGVTVVRTFVPDSLLYAGVRAAWVTLALVGLVLLAAAAAVGGRLAARLSRSVTDLALVAERVGSGDLDAAVTPAGPREVRSVGRVLNSLGARIRQMLADERELGADLSHRLRTPVTALRLDVESLQDRDERALMTAHVDNLVAAIDDAVRAARDPSRSRAAPACCDAAAVVAGRARFWSVLAEETGRRLGVEVPDAVASVGVSEEDLGAAVDALVDNVFSHTPDGTPFTLSVARPAAGVVEVAVADCGPGLSDTALLERGVSGAGSTGIGLDVARRTAVGAGGELLLGRGESGGARVALRLPERNLAGKNVAGKNVAGKNLAGKNLAES